MAPEAQVGLIETLTRETADIRRKHKAEQRKKALDLKHISDKHIDDLTNELTESKQQIAVLKKEITLLLESMSALNADIIDLKVIVKSLIDKLPSIEMKGVGVANEKPQPL